MSSGFKLCHTSKAISSGVDRNHPSLSSEDAPSSIAASSHSFGIHSLRAGTDFARNLFMIATHSTASILNSQLWCLGCDIVSKTRVFVLLSGC